MFRTCPTHTLAATGATCPYGGGEDRPAAAGGAASPACVSVDGAAVASGANRTEKEEDEVVLIEDEALAGRQVSVRDTVCQSLAARAARAHELLQNL